MSIIFSLWYLLLICKIPSTVYSLENFEKFLINYVTFLLEIQRGGGVDGTTTGPLFLELILWMTAHCFHCVKLELRRNVHFRIFEKLFSFVLVEM